MVPVTWFPHQLHHRCWTFWDAANWLTAVWCNAMETGFGVKLTTNTDAWQTEIFANDWCLQSQPRRNKLP
ncbi:hypothetical protein BGX38DRAFT_1191775 [Terfezia claveryi]|nr:hypothetical protein BGX38DRAFT_1191775 [Terfezia claveryi]